MIGRGVWPRRIDALVIVLVLATGESDLGARRPLAPSACPVRAAANRKRTARERWRACRRMRIAERKGGYRAPVEALGVLLCRNRRGRAQLRSRLVEDHERALKG